DSPALVQVLGAGVVKADLSTSEANATRAIARGTPYVALEWIQGRALATDPAAALDADTAPLILSDAQLLPSARQALALSVARDVGQALSDLHALGVAHGDIKPGNIVVAGPMAAADGGCQARLVDLGLGGAGAERE